MLSAARSLIFNAILAERVTRGTWNRLLAGDVANLDGRGSVFAVRSRRRTRAALCRARRCIPTAPLSGQGESLAAGDGARARRGRRRAISGGARGDSRRGHEAERRALRMRVRDLEHEYRAMCCGCVLRCRPGALRPPCFARSSRVPTGSEHARMIQERNDAGAFASCRLARPPVNALNAELLRKLIAAVESAAAARDGGRRDHRSARLVLRPGSTCRRCSNSIAMASTERVRRAVARAACHRHSSGAGRVRASPVTARPAARCSPSTATTG